MLEPYLPSNVWYPSVNPSFQEGHLIQRGQGLSLSLSLSLSRSGPFIPAQTNHFPAKVTTFPVDMELLNPTPPPQLAGNHSTGFSPSRNGFFRASRNVSYTSEISEEISETLAGKVFVAVGKSVDKAIGLLEWTFRQFQMHQITLLHVHQPSPTIPTLLGKLPVSQANEESICAYRREEKEQMNKLLCGYLSICCKAKVQASTVWIESGQVQKGIVELVAKHGIGKLVMGASPDNCMKVKMSSSKVKYTSKNAPPFCQIWFVCKGRHVWTREASGDPKSLPPYMGPPENLVAEKLKSESFRGRQSVPRIDLGDPIPREFDVPAMESVSESVNEHIDLPPPSSEGAILSHLKSKEEQDELESLYNQVIKSQEEADKSKREAFDELLKCKKSESEALEAIKRAKVCEAAHAREVKLRKEVENALRTIQLEQQKLAEHRDEAMQELQKTMKTLAILDGQAGENARRRQEAAGQLKLIQASMATMRHEKQKIRRQRDEALRRLQRWRSCPEEAKVLDSSEYHSCSLEFADYSLLDLQTATCNFSESFMIGRGGYGCVYKGEIFHKTVAIKKLHPENMQGRSEFQQEVRVLSKLRHPNLVKLIGVCSEAWSLVYEYLPNGSLEDRLFCKNNSPPLTWKTRIKIAAEIASALLFLHSSRPEKIVHGDLKPENILLDSNFNCKIGDFGICRLLPEENTNRPVFRRNTEPKGAFLYTDPEFQVTGNLTPKSDVYAFGIIILQLLTGRPPVGLAREVRHAVAGERLLAVLDASAGEWPIFPVRRLVEMGLSFCEMNRRDRPELTAGLVRELKRLSGVEEPVAPSFFLCPILQEIMHDPQVAADGFTYEGEAMLGWLQNGRETSPMTNLKLSHLTLTPNHALRFAIQDWLSKF